MIVRPARGGDAEGIAAIWNRVIAETAITFTTAPKTVDGLRADIAARGACFQVLDDAQGVAGFATCFPFRAGPGYAFTREHSILLDARAQRRGGGRALMAALERAARDEGVHSLFAGVSAENPSGVAFHAALGFAEVARLREVGFKFGRWIDLVLMQKFL